jgi:hypothetical protein
MVMEIILYAAPAIRGHVPIWRDDSEPAKQRPAACTGRGDPLRTRRLSSLLNSLSVKGTGFTGCGKLIRAAISNAL